jgi:ABC-type dipeptide/oligopeptide/nickel transport system permease component
MTTYILRRLASIVGLAFGISVLVFLIIRLIPGDPALALLGTNAGDHSLVARLHQQLGLDEPIPVQYMHWIGNVLSGDFGYSYGNQQSVTSLLAANFPATIQLTVGGLALSLFFGSIIGVVAALRRNSATFNARFVRSSLISAQQQNHVITARAKGINAVQVFGRHVLRNALLPILTIVGLQVGQLISGVVIAETGPRTGWRAARSPARTWAADWDRQGGGPAAQVRAGR